MDSIKRTIKRINHQISWYYARLCLMSLSELVYRIKNLIIILIQEHGGMIVNNVPVSIEIKSLNLQKRIRNNELDFDKELYCHAADKILKGDLNIFSDKTEFVGSPPQWNQEPKSRIIAPLTFGKKLNYRDSSLVGDIKYLWEINRHLQLVTLAQAYHLSKERKYLDEIKCQLESWFKQCPYLMGPNWTSSLELAVRLINWCFVWQFIDGEQSLLFQSESGQEFRRQWLESIYRHVHFIQGYYSRYSSANNHLIGEAAGVFIATKKWPYWKPFQKWNKKAKKILIDEIIKQNYSDGVNKEQAIDYQQFVLDLFILSALAGKRNDDEFPVDYWKRIENMMEYMASIMDVAGNIPMIGDSDDGIVVKLSQENDFSNYKSLLATASVLYNREDFKMKTEKLDDKTKWLLGEMSNNFYQITRVDKHELPIKRVFPDGGYYILGNEFEKDNEVKLVFDSGPLGYLSLAAHGHADALSFTFSISGQEILIDPGTYSYHTKQKWRDYFRSTAAHNTIRVDHQDQSVIVGNFMWSHKASANIEKVEFSNALDIVVGNHDGYKRLKDPVQHQRKIVLQKKTKGIVVTDELSCKNEHLIEFFWHFSESCKIDLTNNIAIIKCNNKQLRMRFDNSVELNLYHGNVDPISGWISRNYDTKVPIFTIVGKRKILGPVLFKTEIDYSIN